MESRNVGDVENATERTWRTRIKIDQQTSQANQSRGLRLTILDTGLSQHKAVPSRVQVSRLSSSQAYIRVKPK